MSHKSVIGLISDTHGLLRPEALHVLNGSDLIIHAGDIGNPDIIPQLTSIAPVRAIRGNIDKGAWALSFPETEIVIVNDAMLLYVLHNIDDLDLDPAAAGFRVIIYGHSHKPEFHRKNGVLYINPGSAGPRRFSLPISVARLTVEADTLSVDLFDIA